MPLLAAARVHDPNAFLQIFGPAGKKLILPEAVQDAGDFRRNALPWPSMGSARVIMAMESSKESFSNFKRANQ
jgi:hypothetical protein